MLGNGLLCEGHWPPLLELGNPDVGNLSSEVPGGHLHAYWDERAWCRNIMQSTDLGWAEERLMLVIYLGCVIDAHTLVNLIVQVPCLCFLHGHWRDIDQ